MSKSRCKVEIPNQLPASGLTRVQFKSWREAMLVYLKQNEDYCVFMQGGRYATWIKSDEFIDRIKEIDNEDKGNCSNQDERAVLLTKRRTDLHTLLNIIGRKVDEYDYDNVLNTSTNLDSVWTTLEQTYDIGIS